MDFTKADGLIALNWTRLSCHDFVDNQVRLQLFTLAYNLGNFLRRLALSPRVKHWTLTTLRNKLIKIGAKVVHHARRVVFQMAEVAIPPHALRSHPPADRTVASTGSGTHMTSTGVENLAFDTEQRQRSAYVLPKLPPAVENTLKTAQDVGQEAGPVAENDGQVEFGAIMLRKMADDGRRPKPNREIPA